TGHQPWDDLDEWGREAFAAQGACAATYRWTTQDYSSADGLPLIGRLEAGSRVYIATGFGGWGLTTAGVAAELIGAQVRGDAADWHSLFDPARDLPVTDTKIISSHRRGLGIAPDQALADLPPDSALVLEIDGEEVAAYRDTDGELHRVSAACTHLGCIVLWARDDRQWECPCHGSRFAPDGEVLRGPANDPLPAR
ncbi:MAG: FAD-dependent oxidoreductase, partial [Thermoleophilia bacterium]|nr:FAD-dependent oxidoreductase [Thermoleophilia bacterium]